MNFRLKIWRQPNRKSPGKLVDYDVRDISPNTSFLEMLDILNEKLLGRGEEPIAFDSDCREGICGTCSLTINGEAVRDDENHAAVFAWEFQGDGKPPMLHREPLNFETVHLTQRSYK